MKNVKIYITIAIISISLVLFHSYNTEFQEKAEQTKPSSEIAQASADLQASASSQVSAPESSDEFTFSIDEVAAYSEQPYVTVHNNVPYFTENDLTAESFEFYSDLDNMGRCGAAYASIGIDTMPTEERGSIGQIKPTGWHTVKYNDIIDGNYLYNRCHLIGYQLAGENTNEKNLITGTRYLNVEGMLPFENMVADYVTETKNHVLYRVTPVFEGDNLVASGVLMEAESVEDKGSGILFCVYVYNIQPGITIDYASGESCLNNDIQTAQSELAPTPKPAPKPQETIDPEIQISEPQNITYILNTNTGKFHYPSCSSVSEMKEKNKQAFTGNREAAISQGYEPCKRCNP